MNKMNINDWHEFNLLDLFSDEQGNIESCKCSNASAFLEEGNDLMYIGAKKMTMDLGIMLLVMKIM